MKQHKRRHYAVNPYFSAFLDTVRKKFLPHENPHNHAGFHTFRKFFSKKGLTTFTLYAIMILRGDEDRAPNINPDTGTGRKETHMKKQITRIDLYDDMNPATIRAYRNETADGARYEVRYNGCLWTRCETRADAEKEIGDIIRLYKLTSLPHDPA